MDPPIERIHSGYGCGSSQGADLSPPTRVRKLYTGPIRLSLGYRRRMAKSDHTKREHPPRIPTGGGSTRVCPVDPHWERIYEDPTIKCRSEIRLLPGVKRREWRDREPEIWSDFMSWCDRISPFGRYALPNAASPCRSGNRADPQMYIADPELQRIYSGRLVDPHYWPIHSGRLADPPRWRIYSNEPVDPAIERIYEPWLADRLYCPIHKCCAVDPLWLRIYRCTARIGSGSGSAAVGCGSSLAPDLQPCLADPLTERIYRRGPWIRSTG